MATGDQRNRFHPRVGEMPREGAVMAVLRHTVPSVPVPPSPSILPRLCQPRTFALLGTCAYLGGFVLPLPWQLPVVVLALMSALAILSGSRPRAPAWPPLTIAVVVFLASVGLSTLVSADLGRSVRLSAALLPGILLFLVIADHFEGLWELRLLYVTCSAVALALAGVVLWAAWQWTGGRSTRALVASLGIPILVVPNDLTFLAVVAPLSLVLFYRKPRGVMGLVAVTSIVVSMGAICVSRSRTAALTMVLSLICTAVLAQPRQRVVRRLAGVVTLLGVALLVNAMLFPDANARLATKFVNGSVLSGRDAQWAMAWALFREAPLLGQGPHTFGLFHRTPWVHNLYLEILAEQGLVGLLALGALLGCGLFMAWKIQRAGPAEARLFGAGALAGLIGLCGAGGAELTLLREWVVAMLFTLLGIIGYLSSTQDQRGRVGSCCHVRQSR
jgi:O-antigen ligase